MNLFEILKEKLESLDSPITQTIPYHKKSCITDIMEMAEENGAQFYIDLINNHPEMNLDDIVTEIYKDCPPLEIVDDEDAKKQLTERLEKLAAKNSPEDRRKIIQFILEHSAEHFAQLEYIELIDENPDLRLNDFLNIVCEDLKVIYA